MNFSCWDSCCEIKNVSRIDFAIKDGDEWFFPILFIVLKLFRKFVDGESFLVGFVQKNCGEISDSAEENLVFPNETNDTVEVLNVDVRVFFCVFGDGLVDFCKSLFEVSCRACSWF